jgi:RNA polymerase sigma-70 factor (ECF subfamily)
VTRPTALEQLTDEELAARCGEQLEGCLDELVRRYERTIAACAQRMSLDRESAEEAVQEILLRLVVSAPRFRGDSAFGTWLYRLAHNTCIDTFRNRVRERDRRAPGAYGEDGAVTGADLDRFAGALGDPERTLDAAVQDCLLAQALSRLPDNYRAVVRLRIAEGRSNQEIAHLIGTTVDSVKAQLRRARRQLRAELTEPRSCPLCGGLGAVALEPDGQVV